MEWAPKDKVGGSRPQPRGIIARGFRRPLHPPADSVILELPTPLSHDDCLQTLRPDRLRHALHRHRDLGPEPARAARPPAQPLFPPPPRPARPPPPPRGPPPFRWSLSGGAPSAP